MKLFTIGEGEKFIPYQERDFKELKRESDLEKLLEKNPEYFFEDSDVLIIGRQVQTNLKSIIDLLGIDKNGDSVLIELKRDKTPRDVIAQLLEYASFVEDLGYTQLDGIFQDYEENEFSLEERHKEYFEKDGNLDGSVSFNKKTKFVIVAQEITREIRQTADFLRKKGIEIYCLEFKYFRTESDKEIITSDLVVGKEPPSILTLKFGKLTEEKFRSLLDENGLKVFDKIIDFGKERDLMIRWGSKGFSLNLKVDNDFVALLWGFHLESIRKQSIATRFDQIERKIKNADDVIEFYSNELENLSYFEKIKPNFRWMINKAYSDEEIERFIEVLRSVIAKIKANR
ncbi:MAG: hypothetical protein SYNGOMJ08_00847 [Candidatus Syntrophoarchaeum sp. GoM_oil]|nr:MAG: hypothetical protein SYNGOMJ08_00847 [Candidatus Syntrophoarchaeum sp. GoM_oil]